MAHSRPMLQYVFPDDDICIVQVMPVTVEYFLELHSLHIPFLEKYDRLATDAILT